MRERLFAPPHVLNDIEYPGTDDGDDACARPRSTKNNFAHYLCHMQSLARSYTKDTASAVKVQSVSRALEIGKLCFFFFCAAVVGGVVCGCV